MKMFRGKAKHQQGHYLRLPPSAFVRRCLNVIGKVVAGTRENHPIQEILLVSHSKSTSTHCHISSLDGLVTVLASECLFPLSTFPVHLFMAF